MAKTPGLRQNKTLPDVIGSIRRSKPQSETGWHAAGSSNPQGVDFQDSWANTVGGTDSPAGWMISEDGEVRLRGRVVGGVEGTTIMTLPEEARPEFVETFIVSNDGGVVSLHPIRFRAYQLGDA